MLLSSTTVYNKCSSKILNEPDCLDMVLPASHGIRRLIKKQIQQSSEVNTNRGIVLFQITAHSWDKKANEQPFSPFHQSRRICLKSHTSSCTHLVTKSTGLSQEWEKGFYLIGREEPRQENKSQKERECNTAYWHFANTAHGHEIQQGPAREDLKLKRRRWHKRKLNGMRT